MHLLDMSAEMTLAIKLPVTDVTGLWLELLMNTLYVLAEVVLT